ncbi:unnamed protein product, partial [Vitis vinifera]
MKETTMGEIGLPPIREHSEASICFPVSTSGEKPVYGRSSSFNSLMPFLTENWGDLPLKVDDSEDMVLYGVLRDAVSVGWTPFGLPPPPEALQRSPATAVGEHICFFNPKYLVLTLFRLLFIITSTIFLNHSKMYFFKDQSCA